MDNSYNNMEISSGTDGDNEHYFYLVEQQVKNIYLNMKYGKKKEDVNNCKSNRD